MGTRTIRQALASLAALAAVACATVPREVQVPVPVPCPAPVLPPRPALPPILATDTDAEARAKILTAVAMLEGYSEQLEGLLAAYANPSPPPK